MFDSTDVAPFSLLEHGNFDAYFGRECRLEE